MRLLFLSILLPFTMASEDPTNSVKEYCPSVAVQERMAAIRLERATKAEKEAEAFRLAVEAGKIEWEVEILMGLEDGKGAVEVLALPLETWPAHDMAENVRLWKGDVRDRYKGMRVPGVAWNNPMYKRYMGFFERPASALTEHIHIHAANYGKLIEKSTVLKDELNLGKALDAIQLGLPLQLIDLCCDHTTPLIKERAKFRIALLQSTYPLLHESAVIEKAARGQEQLRLEKALASLKKK